MKNQILIKTFEKSIKKKKIFKQNLPILRSKFFFNKVKNLRKKPQKVLKYKQKTLNQTQLAIHTQIFQQTKHFV